MLTLTVAALNSEGVEEENDHGFTGVTGVTSVLHDDKPLDGFSEPRGGGPQHRDSDRCERHPALLHAYL